MLVKTDKDRTVGPAEHRTPPALTAHLGSAGILRSRLRVRPGGYARMPS